MEDNIASLFHLDADKGYTVQIVVWSNAAMEKPGGTCDSEFVINSSDWDDQSLPRTSKHLIRFLDQYKQKPLTPPPKKKEVAVGAANKMVRGRGSVKYQG